MRVICTALPHSTPHSAHGKQLVPRRANHRRAPARCGMWSCSAALVSTHIIAFIWPTFCCRQTQIGYTLNVTATLKRRWPSAQRRKLYAFRPKGMCGSENMLSLELHAIFCTECREVRVGSFLVSVCLSCSRLPCLTTRSTTPRQSAEKPDTPLK